MNKEKQLTIILVFGSIIVIAGFCILLNGTSFVSALLLIAIGALVMCVSGNGFREIDKRTNNGIRYIKD